jgi:hypothetical protein
MVDNNFPDERNFGVIASVFYGFKRIKFGHRIQFGNIHKKYGDGVYTDIPSLLLTPLVLQISFF